jgi:sarcosine oxidase subunit delta
MLRLTCPICDVDGEETEFHPGGEAHITREGPGSSDADFAAYLFYRKNPKGVHFERWRHAFGCGKWFHVARCTATLEVFGSYRADTSGPTEAILDAIRARRPGFDAGLAANAETGAATATASTSASASAASFEEGAR